MDIYLAGENGKSRILTAFIGGYDVYNVTPEQIISYGHLSCRRRVRQPSQRLAKSNRKNEGGQNATDLYLSGTGVCPYASNGSDLLSPTGANQFCVLESFYYISADDILIPLIPYFKKFMLDSGAFCEHHIALMYDMKISIAYIPDKRVLGLSKIARIANMVCKRLQLQEKISNDIYEVMKEVLKTEDIAIHIEAKHSCMTARGIKNPSAVTITNKFSGKFQQMDWQHEFLQSLK